MNLQEENKQKEDKISPPLSPNAALTKPKRTCGFQRPFSRDQVLAWFIEIITVCLLYVTAVWYVASGKSNPDNTDYVVGVMLASHIVILMFGIVNWISCEIIDPASDKASSWLGVTLDGDRWTKTRYCAICRKTVPGLDHHCTWLHTCIGTRNYIQFFLLTICGCIQFALQSILGMLYLFCWQAQLERRISDSIVSFKILVVIFGATSIPVFVSHVILLGFHVYLIFKGFGTYDWLLKRRDRKTKATQRVPTPPKANEESAGSVV